MPLMTSRIEPPTQKNDSHGHADRGVKRGWVSWKDLVALLVGGAPFALFYRTPISFPDGGLIVTPAERILRGQVPYRDFFSELAPGPFYIQAVFFQLLGMDMAGIRVTVWVMGVVLTWLLYRLSRKLLDGPLSLLPPLVMVGVFDFASYTVSHHWWGPLFFMLMLICLAAGGGQAVPERNGGPRRRLFMAGLLAAWTLLCMQSLGAWAIVSVVAWLLLVERLAAEASWRDSVRRGLGAAAWFLLGTGAVMGPAACYFWAHGALGAWVYDNFTFLFTNYLPFAMWPLDYPHDRLFGALHWLIREPSPSTFLMFGALIFFSLVAPATALAGASWQIRRKRTTDGSRSRLLLLYLLAGFGCFVSQLHSPDMGHLLWGAPIILILFINAWNEAVREWGKWRRPSIAVAAVAIALVACGAYRRATPAARMNSPVQTRRGTIYVEPEDAAMFQGWVNAIQHAVPPGDETFLFPYNAEFYYLTATHNPTRYDVLLLRFHSPEQFEEAITSIRARQPAYVFMFDRYMRQTSGSYLPGDPQDGYGPDPMEKSLQAPQSHYRLADELEGMKVWTRKR